ncbi:SpoIIE family protein phosphatase [Streptomyces sp. YIM 98790]|uniref:SpoIIE family protein phosphatase n=1 Tax=Streptomyces sp. YIM 98790 TaxID=2689077 RepID=UPI00140C05ED|nr:SpoIIE family protein phosphatase [Streptomyces sp. YIM 98790]
MNPAARPPEPCGPDFLCAVFRDLGAGVFTTDTAGRITCANPWMERLLGRSRAELLGRDAHRLLHRDAQGRPVPRQRCRLLAALAAERNATGSDEFFQRADGGVVPVIWAAAPLRRDGRPAGMAVACHDFSVQRTVAEEAVEHLAQMEELASRLTMVSEVSSVLITATELPEMLTSLVRLLVPELGAWAVVDRYAEQGRRGERAAVHSAHHRDRAERLPGPLPPLPERSRAAVTRLLTDAPPVRLSADAVRGSPDEPFSATHRVLFEQLGGHSAVVVPLRARRRSFGTLTVARAGDCPPYTDRDVNLLADIGRRAGLAMDSAELYHEQRHVAETMQRQLLAPLPQVDHLRMAARYLAAQSAAEVGGDWYDAFLLADGVMALVIGDVVGHDLRAAAHMAEVRNMLRALAWDRREPPSLIMRRLDEAMTNTSDAPMATVVFARLEGGEGGPWRLHWVNAGHPPPLLTTADGGTRFLEGGHGPLLGMSTTLHLGLSWPDTSEELPAESTVLFYTDGLVENRSRPVDTGLALLRGHAAALAGRTVDAFCDGLLERMAPSGDDVTLLALRLPPAGAGTGDDTAPPLPGPSPHSPATPDRAAPGSLRLRPEVEDPTRSGEGGVGGPPG